MLPVRHDDDDIYPYFCVWFYFSEILDYMLNNIHSFFQNVPQERIKTLVLCD